MASNNKRLLDEEEDVENIDNQQPKKIKQHSGETLKSVENNLDYLLDDESWEFPYETNLPDQPDHQETYNLDLSSWKRCKIINMNKLKCEYILFIEECNSEKRTYVKLMENWFFSVFDLNDVVSLYGKFDYHENIYVIDNKDGFFVVSPDVLIASTSIASASYCRRKSIFQDTFKGLDPEFSKYMCSGIILHEIFQTALKFKFYKASEIRKTAFNILDTKRMLDLLYASSVSENDILKEIDMFIPKMVDFFQKHIGNQSNVGNENSILSVEDIEENIWCPQLGLKGKIDVTAKMKLKGGVEEIVPLEIKTGKASFSIVHTGQLALYDMMMNNIGYKVTTGMLLYLRENKNQMLSSSRHVKRDLIMLRNELAYYSQRKIKFKDDSSNEIGIPDLPEALDDYRTCEFCPFNKICTTYASKDEQMDLSHSLKLLYKKKNNYLTNSHMDYFIKWAGLVYLENEEMSNNMKDIWTLEADQRVDKGRSISNLQINSKVMLYDDKYFHTFDTKADCLSLSHFEIDEYIVVSTIKRVAVACGTIRNKQSNSITVALERDLSVRYKNETFFIDKYESNSSKSFNLSNLGLLLNDNEKSNQLRSILIDKKQPSFGTTLPSIVGKLNDSVLGALNEFQKRAVLKALTTDSYCLFKGLPGTGKTQTIVALIHMLYSMNKSVLVTSHTHSAVDNVLSRLTGKQIPFMRLGNSKRVDNNLKNYCEENLVEECQSTEELANLYDKYKIFGITILGASHTLLTKKTFDYCIIDEATQVQQCSAIRVMLSCDKYVLIGDPNQLPPVIKSRKAKEMGGDESIFSRLDSDTATFVLPLQYRMNKFITKIANALTYKGQLECANENITYSTLQIPKMNYLIEEKLIDGWLKRVISPQMAMSVVLLNTLNTYEKLAHDQPRKKDDANNSIYENMFEAALVFYIIDIFLRGDVKGSEIGVIAPFRSQVDLLKKQMDIYRNQPKVDLSVGDVDINTVDQFQGKDKEIIIYSCTKTEKLDDSKERAGSSYEILEDRRRLTVACTRAKKKLIIIADVETLKKYTPFRDLFGCIPSCAKMELKNGFAGFDWPSVMSIFDY